jgi:hypothetical protein
VLAHQAGILWIQLVDQASKGVERVRPFISRELAPAGASEALVTVGQASQRSPRIDLEDLSALD